MTKTVIALLLAFVIVIPLIISISSLANFDLDKYLDKYLDDANPTTSNTGDGIVTITPQGVYIDDEGFGYQTIGSVTYFFKSFSLYGSMNTCYFEMHDYAAFVSNPFFTWDFLKWYHPSGLPGYVDYPGVDQISSGIDYHNKIYVCYTTMTNCSDPTSVLKVLKENVFKNSDYFYVSFIEPLGNSTEAPAT